MRLLGHLNRIEFIGPNRTCAINFYAAAGLIADCHITLDVSERRKTVTPGALSSAALPAAPRVYIDGADDQIFFVDAAGSTCSLRLRGITIEMTCPLVSLSQSAASSSPLSSASVSPVSTETADAPPPALAGVSPTPKSGSTEASSAALKSTAPNAAPMIELAMTGARRPRLSFIDAHGSSCSLTYTGVRLEATCLVSDTIDTVSHSGERLRRVRQLKHRDVYRCVGAAAPIPGQDSAPDTCEYVVEDGDQVASEIYGV